MRPEIALVCTVWGTAFTDFFCDYCLATLLSPMNLPGASASYNFTLLLYTTEADCLRMRTHPNFLKLETFVAVRSIFVESLPPGAQSGHWIQWHHALLSANEFSSFILVIPDCLYANDAITQIAKSLETHEVIYYCIPQICREPALSYIESMTRAGEGEYPYRFLDFSQLDIASLFVKYITPRYAVALDDPEYFVTHPEYILHAGTGQLQINEMTCHALAIGSRATAISYNFNPAATSVDIYFLELLAVGVEYTLKYFDLYYQWPSSQMLLSRSTSLTSWSYPFAGFGLDKYGQTATSISVSGLDATAQQRVAATTLRANYARTSLHYRAAFYAVYRGLAGDCRPAVKQVLALAMCLPGFRSAIMKIERPFTIVLPASDDIDAILDHLYSASDRRRLFAFLLMHILPGRLSLKSGETFVFEQASGRPSHRPRLRVLAPELANSLTDFVTGRVESQPTYVTEDVIAYTAAIRYGSATDFMRTYLD